MFLWSEKGNKVFWFEKSERDGRPILRYPDGNEIYPSMKDYHFEEDWSLAKKYAYVRENLFLEQYPGTDSDVFAQLLERVLEFSDQERSYLFVSASHYLDNIGKFLDKEALKICEDNIAMFYNDPNLQAGWPSLLLFPLCFEAKDERYEPLYINDLGNSEAVLSGFKLEIREFAPL